MLIQARLFMLSKNTALFSLKTPFFIRIFTEKGSFSIEIYIPQEGNEKQIPDTPKPYREISRDQTF